MTILLLLVISAAIKEKAGGEILGGEGEGGEEGAMEQQLTQWMLGVAQK